MCPKTDKLLKIAESRLNFQKNYEPKLQSLVDIRTVQLGFNENERSSALKSMDALMWKLTAAGIHLERLWEFKETDRMKQLFETLISNNIEPKKFTDKEICYLTVELEAYLIQARAFISVAQIHTLDACRISFGGKLTTKTYENAVKNAGIERLDNAYNYFSKEIFGTNKWGALLRSLRDRVLHFDRIRPSKSHVENGEQLCVAGLTIEGLAQDFENGHHSLLINVIAPIWKRKWIAGSYIPGMWN